MSGDGVYESSEPRSSESGAEYQKRVRMLRRVGPILRDLTAHGFTVVVESRREQSGSLESDFVVEYGDMRMRVLLLPGRGEPPMSTDFRLALRHYFLDVTDTDVIAVVADDASLSTSVVDIYDVQETGVLTDPRSLPDAISRYFMDNVLAVELPDFSGSLALPTAAELHELLESAVKARASEITSQRARIPEKVEALERIDDTEVARLSDVLMRVIEGGQPDVDDLLGKVEDEDA